MPKAKRDVAELRKRAINSLVLAIELFNRPHDQGRAETVLILLHHAFEMLLKAVIKDQTGTIHAKGERYTYGFDKCLEVTQNNLKVISSDERATLSILDAHRDIAAHYYLEISEDLLYIQAQASTTLFDDLLKKAFGVSLANEIPERVLPISTKPPTNLQLLLDTELSQIDSLLAAGRRKGAIAAARLRPLIAYATASRDECQRASESDVCRAIKRRRKGDDWSIILPEVARLHLDTTGNGIPIYIRIKKDAELGVRIAKDGEPIVGTLIKQEINIWDKYNMGRDDLARNLGISGPRTSAIVLELGIQEDANCFKVLRRKKSEFKGYSKAALDRIRKALDNGLDVEAVWAKHRHRFGATAEGK